MRVRRTFCNVTMLSQMLPKTLSTRQVSESGGFATAFLMFWSDVPLMVDQHCPSPRNPFEFESKWVSWFLVLQSKDHMRGRLCYFPTRWLWAVSLPPGSKWRRCAELHTKEMVSVMYSCACAVLDNHAAVPRAKVGNLLSKSLANLDPPSAQQT